MAVKTAKTYILRHIPRCGWSCRTGNATQIPVHVIGTGRTPTQAVYYFRKRAERYLREASSRSEK